VRVASEAALVTSEALVAEILLFRVVDDASVRLIALTSAKWRKQIRTPWRRLAMTFGRQRGPSDACHRRARRM
jgi:hypothetical protein